MRAIKTLFPVLIILLLTFFAYQQYSQLPTLLRSILPFLPYVLIIVVAGLALHFNNSIVFFYTLLQAINFVILTISWKKPELSLALLAMALPSLIVIFSWLPRRGILCLRALPLYIFMLVVFSASVWLYKTNPEWFNVYFKARWLPVDYLNHLALSHTVIAICILTGLLVLFLFIAKPSTHLAAAVGILSLQYFQYFELNQHSLTILSSGALLLCLYAVVQESWRMAYLDELTELPGRRALREKFETLSGRYCIAMLDVDHFKKFNDKYGHDIGDGVLRMIATKMRHVEGGGSAYRYGGEEFTVIFNGASAESAKPALEQLRMEIANSPFAINRQDRRSNNRQTKANKNKGVKVTISIGVADSNSTAKSPWDIMKKADKALYRAKKKGRNQTCL